MRGGKGRFVEKNLTTFEGGVRGSGFMSDTLTPGIAQYGVELRGEVSRVCREWARDAVAYMRATAPWNDRTGDARRLLNFAINESLDEVTIYLSHGVWYGVYLELHFNGMYAVILPTMEALGPDLMQRLEAMMA